MVMERGADYWVEEKESVGRKGMFYSEEGSTATGSGGWYSKDWGLWH